MHRYNNYHKHDHVTSIITAADSNTKCIDYINRALELGHTNYFTTNHGCGGDIFEANTLCKQNNLGCKFGIEGYIVPNPLEKDKRNYHIILIPKTNAARKKLIKASWHANFEGYYYKPRFFIKDLLEFEPDELFITTACLGGILKDDDSFNEIFLPLYMHFGKNVMLEVQPHMDNHQIELNNRILVLADKYKLNIIAANDSHYIYESDDIDRKELRKGKNMDKDQEDNFILDYPDYDTFATRFLNQGVLSHRQIVDAIDQTLIFDECEDIYIDTSVKMPTIYPSLDDEGKINKLKSILNEEFPKICKRDNISKEMKKEYKTEIRKEMKVIEDTCAVHSADYFLMNYELIKLAINKYGGTLTRTGRGSGGAFLINKVLGITQIDRLTTNLPIYSERFMSAARLLENKAMPDIDYNIVDQEPFVLASKELLGEHGCYPMIAYGTMKEGEAFRNVCRAAGLEFAQFNEVAKNIDKYRDDPEWRDLIEKSDRFKGTIISSSPHPCAHVLSNNDLREEIEIVRIGDAEHNKSVMCALITSAEADEYKYLKNDYLIVTVWGIISKVFENIGQDIMTVPELLSNLDDKVWKLFEDGITATLNQVDGEWATSLVKKYKPKTPEELAQFVACIRPSFNSFRDRFINREHYTTGSKELDSLFNSTNHYVLFQENLMQYFEWLGVSPAESIGLIKKISKKKIKEKDFENLTNRIRDKWIENTGSIDMFEETWADMQSMLSYGFNSPHGMAYAIDCLYCAYLKANYPIEYYTTVLNIYESKEDSTRKLTNELEYFGISIEPIKFRYSRAEYSYDKSQNKIYKGIASIKYLNKKIADDLHAARSIEFEDFIDVLKYIKENTSVNSKQLEILIKLNFFEEFGNINYLLHCSNLFDLIGNSKILTREKCSALGLTDEELISFGGKLTKKQVRDVDIQKLMRYIMNKKQSKIKAASIIDRISYEDEFIGNISLKINCDESYAYVKNIDGKYKNKIVELYRLKTGETESIKIRANTIKQNPIKKGMVIKTITAEESPKWKIDGMKPDGNPNFVKSGETEMILTKYKVLEE